MYRLAIIVAAVACAGCGSRAPAVPANVAFSKAAPLPTPAHASNGAPPRILAMRFSGRVVRRGESWTGTIVTTTNVASLEVRTSLFSIDVPRTSFGRFSFDLHVLDVPPIFIRAYRVRAIARNSAGVQAEEDFPLRIR